MKNITFLILFLAATAACGLLPAFLASVVSLIAPVALIALLAWGINAAIRISTQARRDRVIADYNIAAQ